MCPCMLTFVLLGIVGGLAYLYLSWHFNYWKKRGVKGPEPDLIYGNVPSIVKRNRHMAFDMQELYEEWKKSGERFIGIFMTRNPQIMVIDPKLAREILVTNFKSFRNNEPTLWVNRKVEQFSQRNPFLSYAEEWKERRTDVTGGISINKLKLAYPIVREACQKMISSVKTSSDKVVDLKALCYKYTVEVMSDFLWGISSDAFNTEIPSCHMLNMSRKMLEESFLRVGFYYIAGLVPFLRTLFQNRFFPEETDKFFSTIQKDSLAMRLRNKTERPDFLNYLIQLQEKKNLSHADMVGYSLTVLLDGFETSGSVAYHTLYYLASNQNAQQKLRDEIISAMDAGGEISFETLMELPYLDQCVHETIRLINPIPVFSRICSDETHIDNGNGKSIKIVPGMVLHIPTYAIHHDTDTYPNPEEYIPDRFDDGRAKSLQQEGRFVPFGDGPRICAGMRLGQLEAKAGVFEIIKNFQLNTVEGNKAGGIDPSTFIIGLSGDLVVEFKPLSK